MTRSSDDGNRKRFRLKRFAEIKVSTRPNYLIKGILPRAGLAVIWGPPKCGKSFWTFDAVMHPALGWEYRGRKVQQGPVVYCALEGGVGFSRRIEAWRQRYLAEAADGDDVPFYLLDVPLNLIADHAALIEDISEQVGDGEPPACVVIDTLNRALAGSENKPEDMSKFIRAADAIWVAFKCLVVIVHHSGLEGSRPRGHTSLPGADEVQIQVERADNGTITTTVEHMKEDEAGATVVSRLERVELGPDDDGEIMSSCVIVACDGPAATAKAAAKDDWGKSKTVKRLRGIIMAMLAEQGTDLRPFADGPMVRALKVEQVRTEFFKTHYTAGETEKTKQNAKRMAFKRAIEAADKAIVIREVGGVEYIWLRSARAEAEAGTARPAASVNTETAKENLAALATVHAEWKKVVGVGETKNLDHVIKVAGDHPSLKAALAAVAPMDDGQTISNVRLARWLHEFNGVPVNGLKLSGGGIEAGSPLWTLQTCDQG